MLTQAKPIPVAFGQALALKDKLEGGLSLQAAKSLKMVTEVVYDFQGTPFYNLTITAANPPKWGSFWDVVNGYTPNLSYTLYGTGGSDIRSIYNFEFGNNLVERLKAVRAAAGSYKRLLSPSGARLYLEDASGGFWEVWTGKQVSQTAIDQDQQSYQRLKQGFQNNPQLIKETKDAWKAVMGDSTAPTPPTPQSVDAVSWKSFTQTDGSLDVVGLAQTLETKGASVQRQGVSAQGDYKYCIGFLCTTNIFAHVMGRNDADNYNWDNPVNDPVLNNNILYGDPYGNAQTVTLNYPYVSNGVAQTAPSGGDFSSTPFGPGTAWGLRDIAGTGIVFTPYSINGCGAQTFTRLMAWFYMSRGMTFGYGSKDTLARDINQPVPADNAPSNIYEPYITKLMGGGSFAGKQTAITPYGLFGQGGGFIAGANNWLTQKGTNRLLGG